MKIFYLTDDGSKPVLVEGESPQPRPGNGELLIEVRAAGVTPSELLWQPTSHAKSGEKRLRAIPGHEFSGVVAGLGAGAPEFEPGEEIYGMNDWYGDGATAEYCIAPASSVARKPHRLSHFEAASVPIAALTAWQGLYDRAQLQSGERVLVQGGAGAVGVFAVQLARLRGARVIATCSEKDFTFLSALGAEQIIDYRASRFEDFVRGVDVVFDTVGGEVLRRSWRVLKPGGRMVTIATGGEETSTDERAKQAFFIVESNQKQLIEVGGLLDKASLQPVVDCVLPFAQANEAYTGHPACRRGRGKVVLSIGCRMPE